LQRSFSCRPTCTESETVHKYQALMRACARVCVCVCVCVCVPRRRLASFSQGSECVAGRPSTSYTAFTMPHPKRVLKTLTPHPLYKCKNDPRSLSTCLNSVAMERCGPPRTVWALALTTEMGKTAVVTHAPSTDPEKNDLTVVVTRGLASRVNSSRSTWCAHRRAHGQGCVRRRE
jgi:hypothetical protein